MYLARHAHETLQRYLNAFPAVGLTGPRQSGKSTFLRHTLTDYHYITFDDYKNVEYFETDPDGFMAQYHNKIIFDEIQFVPTLFNALKVAIDEDRQHYGKFVLASSNQFAYLKNVSESLAGRIGLMSLLPLEYNEMPSALITESIYRGAYPELVTRNYHEASLWFSAYLDTYLNKDIRTLSNIGDMRDFRRFISLLAAQTSQIFEASSYAKDIGISVPTVKRWLSVLEASYIVFLLPPFHNNFGKRIIKSPKIYFYDTGLVSYLTGLKTFEQYNLGPMAGAVFENYIISEIKKKHCHHAVDAELYYLRTSDKTEIDVIIDYKTQIDLIEIKKTSTFSPRLIGTLKKFLKTPHKAYLIYQGETLAPRDQINIVNYKDYLQE